MCLGQWIRSETKQTTSYEVIAGCLGYHGGGGGGGGAGGGEIDLSSQQTASEGVRDRQRARGTMYVVWLRTHISTECTSTRKAGCAL